MRQGREYVTNLRARIDEWLAEPEFVYDLAKGPSAQMKREPWSRITPPEGEYPFDTAGEAGGVDFYCAYRGSSELFTEEQLQLDEGKYCPFGKVVYYVTVFEKVYATESETSMHFFSDEAFDRHCKLASADKQHEVGRHFVLADPRGHREFYTRIACSSAKPAQARKRADELAELFGIRFLVARVSSCFDCH